MIRALALFFAALKLTLPVEAIDTTSRKDKTCTGQHEGDTTCTTPPSHTTIRLGLEWFLNPDHLPFIVAEKHGIFLSLGLDVELVEPSDHWEAEQEIINGNLDVATTEPLHLTMDAAKQKPVLGFMRFFHTDGGVMYNATKIQRPADMCGSTITYPGSPGPGGPAIVNTMVKADGKTDCDIESYQKYNGGFFHTDTLQQNHADVATLIFWNFEIPEAKARGMSVDFFSLKEWGVPDFCQLVLMTTPETFQRRKDDFRTLVLALRRATGVIHQRPELAKQYYLEHIRGGMNTAQEEDDPVARQVQHDTLEATLPAFPNDNMMSNDYFEQLMLWLVETNQVEAEIAAGVPPTVYWTNEVAW